LSRHIRGAADGPELCLFMFVGVRIGSNQPMRNGQEFLKVRAFGVAFNRIRKNGYGADVLASRDLREEILDGFNRIR